MSTSLKIRAALKAEVEAMEDAASGHNDGMDAAMQGLREEQARVRARAIASWRHCTQIL